MKKHYKINVEDGSALVKAYEETKAERGASYSFEKFLDEITGTQTLKRQPCTVSDEDLEHAGKIFGENVAFLIEQFRISNNTLQFALDLEHKQVDNITQGNCIYGEVIAKVAKFFNVKVDDLFEADFQYNYDKYHNPCNAAVMLKFKKNFNYLMEDLNNRLRFYGEYTKANANNWAKSGFPNTRNLIKLAKIFGVSIDDLMFSDLGGDAE